MNSQQIIFPRDVPLEYREGSIRVIASRITLDTLVGIFQRGDSVEEIADGFPTLSLEQIKAVIDWYLTHQGEADEYLEERAAAAEAFWKRISSQPEYIAAHEELLRRREEFLRRRGQLSET